MTTPKRPLMPQEDRNRLRKLASLAERQWVAESPNRAYAQGVVDVLHWLVGEDMSALLQEITR